MPKLTREFSYFVDLTLDEIGAGPFGQRIIANAHSGGVVGECLGGTVVGADADWLLLGPHCRNLRTRLRGRP